MSESLPLISVVVPIYNVEKELDRCVQSILKQTYPNVEVILVDDGSPDQCGKMCDNYAVQYGIVHTIHQPNKGPAYARSVGVSASQGTYIAFCDSDDYLDEDIIEYLYHCLEKSGCNISICAVKHHGFKMKKLLSELDTKLLEIFFCKEKGFPLPFVIPFFCARSLKGKGLSLKVGIAMKI